MRACALCGGGLTWIDGDEQTARERAGNGRTRDTFRCGGCKRLYRHVVHERFGGDLQWWGVKTSADEPDWTDLDQKDWPGFVS